MTITSASIAAAVARAQERMAILEQELNRADSLLGDGDAGSMLAGAVKGMSETKMDEDVGESLANLARAVASATGSSLGTLMATGLLAAAKRTSGQVSVPWDRLAELLTAARDAMLVRGRAQLGDKTVIDAVDAAATGASRAGHASAVPLAAVAEARHALKHMRPLECRIGRARMFAERSKGADDPGMLAFVRLAEAIAGTDHQPHS